MTTVRNADTTGRTSGRIRPRAVGVAPRAVGVAAIFAPLLAPLLAGLSIGAAGCGDSSQAAAGPGGPGGAPPTPKVTVATPVQREVIEWDTFTGRLEAVETVEVRPRVGGYVTETPFTDGSLVKKGDPLYTIDPRPFQAAVDGAAAQVEQARAKVDFAKTEFDQAVELQPKNAISPVEYQQRQFNLKDAQAALSSAQAQLETANLNLSFTDVTAPIDGRIGRKLVTPGNLVTGGTNGPEATLLAVVTSVDPMYCYVDVDEASVLKYQRLRREKTRDSALDGRIPAFLQLANETDFPHEGTVDFVDNRVDPDTGTIRARAVFPNENNELTPGYFGRIRIPGSGRYDALLVADKAIGTDQSQRTVMVVDPETKEVSPRRVQTGPLFGGLRVVKEGLSAGELVVVNGGMSARPGSVVDPTVAPMPEDLGPGALGAAAAGTGGVDENQQTAPGSPTTRSLPTEAQIEADAPPDQTETGVVPKGSPAGDDRDQPTDAPYAGPAPATQPK